jgi:exopolyphosphatase/guanosine-5'-triphosphate,3'-diphosphate pyrophosphatase
LLLRFAAIDIGSNAIRLLFSNVYETSSGPIIKKASLIRIPIRLGEDAFNLNRITEEKIVKLIKSMKAFRNLMEAYDVVSYKACATSAMRDAENGPEVIKRIFKESGVKLHIIDGESEAQLIFETHIADALDSSKNYLYMDVGGGSTEYTIFKREERQMSRSFDIGTIRLRDNLVKEGVKEEMDAWLKEVGKKYQPELVIGSGGNINKLFKMSGLPNMKVMKNAKIKQLKEFLESHSLEERIEQLGLRPDRADVIIPAAELFLNTLKQAKVSGVLVPKVGLADGIIHQLYHEFKSQKA